LTCLNELREKASDNATWVHPNILSKEETMNALSRITLPKFVGGIATATIGVVLLAFSTASPAQYEDYEGPEFCKQCHEENYNDWRASGHPYKLMKGEEARFRPIPLPEGIDWDDVSYVIGGYKWKSRYMDQDGYIITSVGENGDVPGQNQYNYLTGRWVDYNAGVEDKPYDCGQCHTTGWIANEDPTDLTGNQDGKPGIHGTFFAGGIQCEQCHGPGMEMSVDTSAAFCGECHFRGDLDTIPASGGFIRHHEQYNEHLAGPHASLDCVSCHDPHKRGEFSIKEGAECGSCHSGIKASFETTSMYDYGVECKDCHMPFASKSADALGPYQGDVMTHIFYINTDPAASMFTEDGGFVALDENGKGAVTLDFVCQRCHETASLDELAKFAKDFHGDDKTLADVGLTPGLTGTWWNSERAGEGFLLQFGDAGGLTLFASFYTYAPDGSQVWLVAQSTAIDGITADVNVYITNGRQWGDAFDPNAGETVQWGTGSFTFADCNSGSIVLTPNETYAGEGFTALSYDITRDDFPVASGITCPTFVNNAQ
jgi:hypothetical protein